jgi:hypothetical protein
MRTELTLISSAASHKFVGLRTERAVCPVPAPAPVPETPIPARLLARRPPGGGTGAGKTERAAIKDPTDHPLQSVSRTLSAFAPLRSISSLTASPKLGEAEEPAIYRLKTAHSEPSTDSGEGAGRQRGGRVCSERIGCDRRIGVAERDAPTFSIGGPITHRMGCVVSREVCRS